MKIKFYQKTSWLFSIGLIVWIVLHSGILTGKYLFTHDSFYWYGLFHYFTESLQSGFIPLWNPYLHGGEAFFANMGMWGLLDPITVIAILTAKIFGINDLFLLYEITTFIKLFLIAAGVQLLLNMIVPEVRKYWYFTYFILLLSSFSLNSYHQNGAFLVFSYVPFVLLFLLRFFKNPNWFNTVILGFFAGISFQSMHFFYIATFIFVFLIVYLLCKKETLSIILNNKIKLTSAFIIFLLLSAPAWSLIFYKDSFYPYARAIFNPIELNPPVFFSNIEQYKHTLAAFGYWGDFLTLGFGWLATSLYTGRPLSFSISEMNMYIGFIPFILGIIGIFAIKHELKKVFLILMFISAFLFIGPVSYNAIYSVLFYIFPILRGIENTHVFANYFLLCYLYFVCLGVAYLSKKFDKKWIIIALFFLTLIELSVYADKIYSQKTMFSLINKEQITENKFSKIEKNNANFTKNLNFKLSKRIKTVYSDYDFNVLKTGYYKSDKSHIVNNVILGIKKFNLNEKIKFNDPTLCYLFNIEVSLVPEPNFSALIKKIPVATDYYSNFPYKLIKCMPPNVLIYPKFYTDILKSDISDELKSGLLGVKIPPLQFYTGYEVLPANKLLNKEKENNILKILSESVILSNTNLKPLGSSNTLNNAEIKVLDYKPHHIKIELNNEQDGILLFRDGYDPSWVAKIDGNTEKIIRANYNSKAIYVPKGFHSVEFIFNPKIYNIALILYILGIVGILIYITCYLFYLRKSKKSRIL